MINRTQLPSVVGLAVVTIALLSTASAHSPFTSLPQQTPTEQIPTAKKPSDQNPSASPPSTQRPQPQAPPRNTDITPSRGHTARPPSAETLATPMAPYSVQMFIDDDFKGTEVTVTGIDNSGKAGALNELTKGLADSMSSVRWSLPAGLIAVFYEDASGKGEQLVLWGEGQYADLKKVDFENKASRWTWFDLGGGTSSPRSTGANMPPIGSETPDITVPDNAIQMHVDKNFRDDMQQISPVTAQTPGAMHELPGNMRDRLTSLRWNLPDGVIVMLYQNANGKKQQVALWGQGQLKDLDLWDFNDKASRWSWTYVGTAPTMTPTPPAKPTPPSSTPPAAPTPTNPPPSRQNPPSSPPSTLTPGKP